MTESRDNLLKKIQQLIRKKQLLNDINDFLNEAGDSIQPDVYAAPSDYSEIFDDIYETLNEPIQIIVENND